SALQARRFADAQPMLRGLAHAAPPPRSRFSRRSAAVAWECSRAASAASSLTRPPEMSATSEMIPYPCWVPDASAVRMRNVASCIARLLITATYIDELAVASSYSPEPSPKLLAPVRSHYARVPY